jgi:hypothetical protein
VRGSSFSNSPSTYRAENQGCQSDKQQLSSALTRFINTSGDESMIDQDFSDINANNYNIAVARVVKNLDFKDLRPGGMDRGCRKETGR